MLVVMVVLAFVVGVGMVLGGFSALEKLPQFLMQRRLDARLQEVAQPQAPTEETAKKLLVKVQHEGPLPVVDRMLGGTERGNALSLWIEQSGMKVSLSGVLLISLALAAVFALLAGVIAR